VRECFFVKIDKPARWSCFAISPAVMQANPETICVKDRIGRLPQQSITNKQNKYPVKDKFYLK